MLEYDTLKTGHCTMTTNSETNLSSTMLFQRDITTPKQTRRPSSISTNTLLQLEEQARQKKRERKFSEALELINSALTLEPDDHCKLYLKAMIYEDSGDLTNALNVLTKLINIEKKNSQYHYNYARCLYFLNRYAEARDHLMAVLRSFRGRLETPYQYAVRVLVPLLSFITEPPSDELLQLLNEADHWDSSVKSRILKDERIRIDYIFQFIIGELVKGGMSFPQSVPSCSHNRMYLLGESHILPLSWQQVNLGDMQYLLSPMLVMGLKAYLFSSNAPECKEKSTLHSHLQNIPVNSLCLVVAGEIDCRHGVGIAKAMEHGKYSNIEDAICETVEGYLAGLSKLSYEKNLTFFVHCVRPPLPPRHTNRAPLTYAQLEQEKLRILLFNQALRQGIQRLKSSRIILLDLYEQLSDEEGWMKLEYKNDDMHMNYKYLPVLQKALSESHWDAKAQNDAKETTTNTVLLHMLYS